MFANSVLLLGESEARFIQMVENFNNELQPQSETEQALVDMIATARWRQMRVWGIERAILTQEMLDQVALLSVNHPGAEEHMDLPARAALAFRTLADNSRSLQMINRYESANPANSSAPSSSSWLSAKMTRKTKMTKQSQISTYPNKINNLTC